MRRPKSQQVVRKSAFTEVIIDMAHFKTNLPVHALSALNGDWIKESRSIIHAFCLYRYNHGIVDFSAAIWRVDLRF